MNKLRSMQEVTDAFLKYSPTDIKGNYSLGRMRRFMAHLGNPQNGLRVVHIAGTSGKTSTAYFIRGMLEAAGKRTGLTVSPHIVAINERVQIAGQPLPEQKFIEYANEFLSLVKQTTIHLTYFELLVGLAYWVFKKEQVDYAVVETGLGGLLDGTNVVQRPDKICVITDIGLDHTEILGETVQQIAMQKAGIIQPHNVVFVQQQKDIILHVICRVANKAQAAVHIVHNTAAPVDLPLFQQRNWRVAEAVYTYVTQRDNLPDLTVEQRIGVTRQTPPGRFERITVRGKTVILDGAHNPQKLLALRESLHSAGITSANIMANFIEAPRAKIEASLNALRPMTDVLIIPEFYTSQDINGKQSLKASELKTVAKQSGFRQVTECADVPKAFELLVQTPGTSVVTGSLYLVSFVKKFLRDKYKII